jgi:predicted phosphodiesterase
VNGKAVGIFQLSDLHLNELINIKGNKFDFLIASKRLRKFVIEAKRIFKAYNVNKVLIAFTGDFINSDRRLDELANMATNRSKAQFLAVDLLSQVIQDLSCDFSLTIANVTGNESRIKDEVGYSDLIITDNYDWNIFHILRIRFEKRSDIEFIMDDDKELIVSVAGRKVLLVHGEVLSKGDVERAVIQLAGKHSARGDDIDLVLFGHLHYCRIGDTFARSSSLCGANAYSDSGLHLVSRASQNLHI